MIANTSCAETEPQEEGRELAVNIPRSVASTIGDSKTNDNICLSEYDVVSRLQLVSMPIVFCLILCRI